MYFISLRKSECSGCTACEHVCPVGAITFSHDQEGFKYPSINKDKCINCKKCERICPFENPDYSNQKQPATFAALVKDVKQRMQSSSGGLFYVIAQWILEKEGKVYGATMDRTHQVFHIGIDDIKDIGKLRGSKYVQSDLQNVFVDIKNQLESGRWCYFVGTGCQVAGLKAFLHKDYERLLTSDLVCHGVPSQWLFDQHIEYLEKKYKGEVIDYKFRNNELWEGCEIFDVICKNGRKKHVVNPTYYISPYLYSFMYGMTSRLSCYNCKFAAIPRQGDITLADYWGVRRFFPDINSTHGVSLVLANNAKGLNVLESVKHMCEFYVSNVEDGAQYNGNLTQVSISNKNRDFIYKIIKESGYSSVTTKEFRAPNYFRIKVIVFLRNTLFFKQIWNLMAAIVHKIH